MKKILLVIMLFVAFGISQEVLQDTTVIKNKLKELSDRYKQLTDFETRIALEKKQIEFAHKTLQDLLNPPKVEEETEAEETKKKKKK